LEPKFVSETMRRNSFLSIKIHFHVADNDNLKKATKWKKTDPLYKGLNESLIQIGIFHSKFNIGESILRTLPLQR